MIFMRQRHGSEMKVPVTEFDMTLMPKRTWWKERTNSYKLFFDIHAYTHRLMKFKILN